MLIYLFIAVLDVILLIITAIKLFTKSFTSDSSQNSQFANETKWFWIIIKLSVIMSISWQFESSLWREDFDIITETIVDFVNLFTAATLSFMLLGRRKTKILLFGKYQEVKDVEENEVIE
jgi:hypothetical protein